MYQLNADHDKYYKYGRRYICGQKEKDGRVNKSPRKLQRVLALKDFFKWAIVSCRVPFT